MRGCYAVRWIVARPAATNTEAMVSPKAIGANPRHDTVQGETDMHAFSTEIAARQWPPSRSEAIEAEWEAWQDFQYRLPVLHGRQPRVIGARTCRHRRAAAEQRNNLSRQVGDDSLAAVLHFANPQGQTRPVYLEGWPRASFREYLFLLLSRGHTTQRRLASDLAAVGLHRSLLAETAQSAPETSASSGSSLRERCMGAVRSTLQREFRAPVTPALRQP